jgi:hypothetical protein
MLKNGRGLYVNIQHNEQFCTFQIKAILLHKTIQLLVKSYHFFDGWGADEYENTMLCRTNLLGIVKRAVRRNLIRLVELLCIFV